MIRIPAIKHFDLTIEHSWADNTMTHILRLSSGDHVIKPRQYPIRAPDLCMLQGGRLQEGIEPSLQGAQLPNGSIVLSAATQSIALRNNIANNRIAAYSNHRRQDRSMWSAYKFKLYPGTQPPTSVNGNRNADVAS
jgi:hypothetical protein